jgi:putative ABC transport system permease protein
MRILLRLTGQSALLAVQELWNNKLRAALSLMGISIGIICIISVLSAVDSLQRNIKTTIQSLGNDLVFIEKWPWTFSPDYPWWQYYNRPNVSEDELAYLKENLKLAKAAAYQSYLDGCKLETESHEAKGVTATGITPEYNQLRDLNLEEGRYFTPVEFYTHQGVVILGNSIAHVLFPNDSLMSGKEIKFKGERLRVVGVLKKEGKDFFDASNDNIFYLPSGFLGKYFDKNAMNVRQTILVKPKDGVDLDELKEELAGVLRMHRRIRPTQKENFALNQISMITSIFDPFFSVLTLAGVLIGGFSILVGGFGIANIMFVSVKERTNIIGIKKALGARSVYILIEFIVESVLLCLFGGIVGLIVVFLIFQGLDFVVKQQGVNFKFIISATNIYWGVGISIAIGIIFGLIPAIIAARLHPVDAIRQG